MQTPYARCPHTSEAGLQGVCMITLTGCPVKGSPKEILKSSLILCNLFCCPGQYRAWGTLRVTRTAFGPAA
jgi:hypothetical protein